MSDETKVYKEFNYNSENASFRTKVFPFVVLILFGFIMFWLFVVFPGDFLLYSLGSVMSLLMLGATLSYLMAYPNIKINDDEVIFTVPFKTYSVKFDDIKNIEILDSMFTANTYRVDLTNLSNIHRIVGTIYGSKGKPSILIEQDIDNFDELLQVLIAKTGIKPRVRLWN